jgi:thiamine-phosphate pyrophosphorylase
MRLHAVVSDLETARTAAAGGATVVQLRCKRMPTEELVETGRPFRELCWEHGLTLIVNDDVQAALALDADGVHLGRGDSGAGLAIKHGLLVGMSAASVDEAVSAELAEAAYIGAGPVWSTPTKPDAAPAIGLDGLRSICAAVSVPVIAIGGVDAGNAPDCIRAGAAGVAVVRGARDAAAIRAALDAAL